MREKLFFDSVKEHRGDYFVDYQPPASKVPLATLSLILVKAKSPEEVTRLMEQEAARWLSRYPIPVMVFALDDAEDPISLDGVRSRHSLLCYFDEEKRPFFNWDEFVSDDFLQGLVPFDDLREAYPDIPYRTQRDVDASAKKWIRERRQQALTVKAILIVWFAIVPGIILFLGFANYWVGLAAFAYSLYRLAMETAKILGWREPSASERRKTEEDWKTRDFVYHCKLNPEGFARLKSENLRNEFRRRTVAEAEELAGSQTKT